MNQSNESRNRGEEFADAWDCTPRDGPAVFITDANALDEHGVYRGGWLDPTDEIDTVRAQIEAVVEPDREWAVVDQVGLGSEMVPEELSVEALVRFCRLRVDGPA